MNADNSNNSDIIIITVKYDLNPALACGLCWQVYVIHLWIIAFIYWHFAGTSISLKVVITSFKC